jgi:hypothetical protein
LEEIFDCDDEKDQEKDMKEKELKEKDLEGKKDQLSEEDN